MQQSATQERPFFVTPGIMARVRAWLRGGAVAVKRMRHIETLLLGPKRSLYLVECDGKTFLLAASGDGVSAPVPVDTRAAEQASMRGLDLS